MSGRQVKFTSSNAMRLKIVNPENLEQEIKQKASAFRTMAESTKKLKDLAVERMGGTIARAEIFEEQAEPIVGAIERISKGKAMNPKDLEIGERVKARLTQNVGVAPRVGDEEITKNPLDEVATKRDIQEAVAEGKDEPAGAAPPAYEPLKQLREEATQYAINTIGLPRIKYDETKISLKPFEGGVGGFAINNVPVELTDNNTKLTVRGRTFDINPRLMFALTGYFSLKMPEQEQVLVEKFFEDEMTGRDWETWRDILRSAGIGAAQLKEATGFKAKFIRNYLDNENTGKDLNKTLGMGHKKLQSGKVVRGKFGELVVDETQLGKGIFSAKDPDGNLVFHAKVSDGVRHLLKKTATKAQAGKGKFSEKDLETYHELASMARVNHKPTDTRKVLKDPAVKSAVFLPDDPKKLMDRLQTLMGLHGQGNDNRDVKTEALAIADRLLKSRNLTKGQHKTIFQSLI